MNRAFCVCVRVRASFVSFARFILSYQILYQIMYKIITSNNNVCLCVLLLYLLPALRSASRHSLSGDILLTLVFKAVRGGDGAGKRRGPARIHVIAALLRK